MDMAMMGLLGTVAGASTMGIMGIMDSVAKTFLPRFAANTEHPGDRQSAITAG